MDGFSHQYDNKTYEDDDVKTNGHVTADYDQIGESERETALDNKVKTTRTGDDVLEKPSKGEGPQNETKKQTEPKRPSTLKSKPSNGLVFSDANSIDGMHGDIDKFSVKAGKIGIDVILFIRLVPGFVVQIYCFTWYPLYY